MIEFVCKICNELKPIDMFRKSPVTDDKRCRKLRTTSRTCRKCDRDKINLKRRQINAQKLQETLFQKYGTNDQDKIKEIKRLKLNDKKRELYHTRYKSTQKKRVKDWIKRNKEKHREYCKKSNQKSYNKLIERLNQTYSY